MVRPEIRDNPIARLDPALGAAFEEAALDALRHEVTEPVIVTFGIWRGDDDGPRYVCRVEAEPTPAFQVAPAWRWWSPLVTTPDELATCLREALTARRSAGPRPAPESPQADRLFWGWGAAGQVGA
jgi:hypothetical protein